MAALLTRVRQVLVYLFIPVVRLPVVSLVCAPCHSICILCVVRVHCDSKAIWNLFGCPICLKFA